jgi:hypothetical protein
LAIIAIKFKSMSFQYYRYRMTVRVFALGMGGARAWERSPGRRSLKKYVWPFTKIEATKTAIFTVAAVLSRQDGMNRHSTSTNQSITMYQETVVTSLNDVFALSVQFPTSKTNKMGNLPHLFSLNKFMLQSLHVPSHSSMACLFSK